MYNYNPYYEVETEMMQEVKIAGSRVGVLIGKGGSTKKET